MVFRYLNRPRSGSTRAFDADVLLWQSAVVANGGSVSPARLIIIDQFVFSEKDSGAWTLTDDYWGLWGENAEQALTSLKQRRLATAVNSPTFTVDRGYTGNGTTSYVNTGFVPSTHAVVMTGTSLRVDIYDRTSGTTGSGTSLIGGRTSTNQSLQLRPVGAGNLLVGSVNAPVATTLSVVNSLALTSLGRGATAGEFYYRGVLLEAVAFGATSSSLPGFSVFIGAANAAGTPTGFTGHQAGFGSVGAPLSADQELARYNAVQAWATSVGANV